MIRTLAAVFALLLVVPALAQEMTIFDVNDFVDPRVLGTAAASNGNFKCPCVQFLIARAIGGWDHDFLNVTMPTNVDVGFAHLATSFYRGSWQVNAKATVLRDVHRSDVFSRGTVPQQTFTLQLGHYREVSLDEDEKTVRRLQFTWRINRHLESQRVTDPIGESPVISPAPQPPPSESDAPEDLLGHEFGIEYDTHVRTLVGSIAYTLLAPEDRRRSGFSDRPSRVAMVYRLDAYQLWRFRIEPTLAAVMLGHGAKIESHLTIQPSVRVALPLAFKTSLNARVAPTFQRFGGWQRYYEVALFVDRPIFAKTW